MGNCFDGFARKHGLELLWVEPDDVAPGKASEDIALYRDPRNKTVQAWRRGEIERDLK